MFEKLNWKPVGVNCTSAVKMTDESDKSNCTGIHQHTSHHSHEHVALSHNSWNAEDYEKKLKAMNYNGPKLVAEQFDALGIPNDSKIMDLAAGTGLVGSALKDLGYTNIDALDGSVEMLVAAKERQCYQNIIAHFIERDTKLPVDDHSYDHIIMSGALCHIDFENLPQIISICRPGGIICWAIGQSEDLIRMEPKFSDGRFEKYVNSLCDQNLWEFLPGFPKNVENFAMERDGWVYAMKVL
ncbi:Methyltransferase-like protein 27 [Pseudolycoriella hygida]|uniref:Methyltransferase-like protein 27 n=1 Tax=Pseudolycoriella hygida TaxID=35572 RepID=A0A9Q0NHU5_9DIPT|nr:Methyltransferase-like protein 27 [Pseudolycoriella hygida]